MAKKVAKGSNSSSSERTPQLVEHVSDSSDEEIDEDEAFNSEDELRYGSLFNNKKAKKGKSGNGSDASGDDDDVDDDGSYSVSINESDDDDDDDSMGLAGSDDDEEEGDGGQYMLDLLNNMDNSNNSKNKAMKEERRQAALAMSHSGMMEESEFSAAAVNSTGLTMDQLMSGITDTKGFGTVQKTVGKMMSNNNFSDDLSKRSLTTTKAPASRVVSERASRKVHYEEQKDDVTRWTEIVKQNREAETLDFRPKDRAVVTRDELVSKFEPTTDFEKELAEVLEKAGVSNEKEMMKQEEEQMLASEFEDDLGGNKLTMEEYKRRMGELSKMRALMFYEEQKRHHINKIKSKKYRKIRKKKREKMKDAEEVAAAEEDPDFARELEEKQEMERMKERMTLAHKNTSKWAKRVLRRGGNIDMDTRKALSAQLRIGDDLRSKMMGEMESDGSDDENNLVDQAKMLLADAESAENKTKGKSNSLLEMSFMKKGAQVQRKKAIEEARELLAELEGNENSSSDSSDSEKSAESDEESKPKKKRATSVKNTEKVLEKGSFVAKSLQFGSSNIVSVGGNVGIDIDFLNSKKKKKKVTIDKDNADGQFTLPKSDISKALNTKKEERKPEKVLKNDEKTETKVQTSNSEVNPWLQPESDSDEDSGDENKNGKRKKQKVITKSTKSNAVDVSGAVHIVSSDDGSEEKVRDDEKGKSNAADMTDMTKDDDKLVNLSQDELVRRAFASPAEDDIDEEFEKEKDAMRERDDPSKKQKEDNNSVSGWGSWTGQGAPAPRPPKSLPKRLKPPTKKEKKRKRQDDGKKNVIINEKRVKKNAQYQIANIPYPFTSREQYERAMCGGVGYEWNVTGAVKAMTREEVVTRTGKIIRPINKNTKSKNKRAPAKF